MAKKRSSQKSQQKTSPLVGLLAALAVAVIVILSQVTGIDLVGILGLGTPQATPVVAATSPPGGGGGRTTVLPVGQGFGARKGFWDVYFTAPTGSTDRSRYVGGVDEALAAAIRATTRTLDVAAFELNSPAITEALLDARRRGVGVRVVADNEHTIEDDDSTMGQIVDAGIPVVYDNRSAFMHNKFMIMDGASVWTGSTNWTINDVYRNNNNLLALRSRRAVETYQAEFNEMFSQRSFGPRSPASNSANYQQDGVSIQILFAPEGRVIDAIINEVNAARSRVRFMAFSFTQDDLGQTMLRRAGQGITIEGIFETRGSETEFSELRAMHCAGLDVRQDGNNFTFHHKVIIIDTETVITGSFNFSENAVTSNDENLLIIKDRDLAAQYIAEYERMKAAATRPTDLTCR
jgi:phosphatidylserine/phosphatidylglycerophosphate/cardiolipin synthase-like enzyme